MRSQIAALVFLVAMASATKYLIDEDVTAPQVLEEPSAGVCRVYYQVTKFTYGRCQSNGPGVCVADDNRMNIFSKDCGFGPMMPRRSIV